MYATGCQISMSTWISMFLKYVSKFSSFVLVSKFNSHTNQLVWIFKTKEFSILYTLIRQTREVVESDFLLYFSNMSHVRKNILHDLTVTGAVLQLRSQIVADKWVEIILSGALLFTLSETQYDWRKIGSVTMKTNFIHVWCFIVKN